jgi:hypothetical protein
MKVLYVDLRGLELNSRNMIGMKTISEKGAAQKIKLSFCLTYFLHKP